MPYPADQWIKGQEDSKGGMMNRRNYAGKACPSTWFFSLFFVPKWEHSGDFHLAKEKGLIFLAPKSF
jgi:hypothetical protein